MMLVKQGVADLKNVIVHPTGDYLISAATFPTYFIKDKDRIPEIRCQLDLEVFANHFAPALNITRRFVGTEPLCQVTDAYNRQMLAILPQKGIEVTLVERKELDGGPISASRVRALLEEQKWEELSRLVPPTTLAYLREHYTK
jgi:[citrate (pro-3S)-lyase] ligase